MLQIECPIVSANKHIEYQREDKRLGCCKSGPLREDPARWSHHAGL